MSRFVFRNFGQNAKNRIKKISILIMWLLIWQTGAALIDNDILLAGPVDVGKALGRLLITWEFYKICMASLWRIFAGFLLAFASGILAGGLFYALPPAEELFEPVLSVMKSIPVASFVVLLLIWQGADDLSVWISFFVVFPNACVSMKNGLKAVDSRLLEMADIFKIRGFRRLLYIYRPALMRFLSSGMEICVGMAFKSGVAAEVIGVPDFSIGERIYISKIYLDTPGLFAWTIALIFLSFLVERLVLRGMALLAGPVKAYGRKGALGKAETLARESGRRQESREQKERDRSQGNNGAEKTENAVTLSHVYKSFGEKEVLSDINMEIKRGARYVLTGPSGSGKTTLLRIIAGLEQADKGKTEGKAETAFLFQEDRLLENEFTITNIMLTKNKRSRSNKSSYKADGKDREGWYEEAAAEILPKNCLFLPAHALSGGMKRRCALARTLFYQMDNKDAVCLLDEPFAGLDEETKKNTAEFIKKYLMGRTLIVAAHDEKDAELLGGSIWNVKREMKGNMKKEGSL